MKKTIFTLIIMSVLVCNLFAQQTQTDSIDYNKELIEMQNSINSLNSRNAELTKTLNNLEHRNKTAENKLSQLQSELSSLKNDLDSTNNIVSTNAQNTKAIADTLGLQIKETNTATDSKVASVTEKLSSTTVWGVVAVAITLIISLLVAFLLHKRGNKNVTELQKKAEA